MTGPHDRGGSGPSSAAAAADSAGQPWGGRSFPAQASASADDGSAPTAWLESVARFRAASISLPALVAALRPLRLLVPLVAVAGEEGMTEDGRRVDKTQELSIVTVAAPDGRAVLPAFSSVDAMRSWNPDARPVPVEAARVAIAAGSEGTPLVIVDPTTDTEVGLRRPAVRALATGEPWTPSYDDPEVLDRIRALAAGHKEVTGLRLEAGDRGATLTGAESVAVVALRAGLSQAELHRVAATLSAAWQADPLIQDRTDSLAIRFTGGEKPSE